ncbi:pentatricopeptide repeat-containing protein [Tripterygium wilfordii]|uniref:Pentatricopeptide repeat-containing protein n=1 Tax=Tripterygium wilfordii TaxID=458696 RepID=A0A7J7DHE3_TRIWF|nr:pentatricopeptide repeat-containing protein At2g17033 [Tripterygium wilfordii]KAF5745780.1 pentatricopeptide repeat-containing protein [Tripterygium wilfordii]
MYQHVCIYSQTATISLSWSRSSLPPPSRLVKSTIRCVALTKQGERFLNTIAAKDTDSSLADRLIGKFVAASSKSVALNALSYLLSSQDGNSRFSSLALPLYYRITEASWFNWNPKLMADLIALLDKRGRHKECETLMIEATSKLSSRERELAMFYCNLMDSLSKQKSERGFDDCYDRLYRIVCDSCSVYVKRQGYKSMIGGLCERGEPKGAQNLIEEMRMKGIKPSLFEFRSVLYAYGRLGLFADMQRSIDEIENEGFKIDTVCSNMVLSSYGAHDELPRMVSWLQKMRTSGIQMSTRTYNTTLNSCPTLTRMLQGSNDFPVSITELVEILSESEVLLVKELACSSVLEEAMEWDSMEAKLDLHGMHLGSAYLIMLQWMEEMRRRLGGGEFVVPAGITVVCGSGKHSSARGESPIKIMVKKMMIQTKSPMRIDRKNIGCFVAKGKAVKDWLFQ